MKIKTIDINAKEWFDKINGNSYFSAILILNYGLKNQKEYVLPFQYGYGDHYIDMAKEILIKENIYNIDKFNPLWRYCEDNNIILRTSKQVNCKKRELISN